MAFLNLRNNNLIYILHKNEIPSLEIGKITNVSIPTPKYGNPGMFNEMILDISVDVNGTTNNFLKLPANADIADVGSNTVITCNRDAMNNEVQSMKLRSLDIINSIEQHLNIVKGCDEILKNLNPEIAERLRQERENRDLRAKLDNLESMLREFIIKSSLKQYENGNSN